ncbi:MAG TPA: hypothetical protein VFM18_12880 [Methanosarcina sp.]|nr:hypothetical protein [Methanosarcina sp.]
MNVILHLFNPSNGAFAGEKIVNLPHYFLPQSIDKTLYIEPEEPLTLIAPEFSDYDVLVELI